MRIPDVTDADLDVLVAAIDRQGFGLIPNFLDDGTLARMRDFVGDAVARRGGEYAGFVGAAAVAGSGLDELAALPAFRALLRRIYVHGTDLVPPRQELYQVLRCLAGKSGRVHNYFFHFDSYIVTILIPIRIPTVGQTGDLMMVPNFRGIRRFYLMNVIDKIVLDNRLTQFLLRIATQRGLIRLTRIKMVPGNAYVFWGYRSIHMNEPCDPAQVRATALFHFANPHAGAAMPFLRASREAAAGQN